MANAIQEGHTVLLRLPSGETKSFKLEHDTNVTLGKFGAFKASKLFGQPYGLTYEILDKDLKVLPPKSLQDLEDTSATNELIVDAQDVQPLTFAEIEALKSSGADAASIIKLQIEQHSNFNLKTEYSKDKYKKRKEAKFSKSFTTIEPTLFNVCEYYYHRHAAKIRDLRIDTLSQVLNLANIFPGSKSMVVDDVSGLVVAGVLERLGGFGRIIAVNDLESQPTYVVVNHMNFQPEFVAPVLSSLNWAMADESYTPYFPPTTGDLQSDKHKARLLKRQSASDAILAIREELFRGGFDSLIVASQYEPFSVVSRLMPYLRPSGSVVVYSPYSQLLCDAQYKMRMLPEYLGPTVTEAWLRQYQVLPGRTHPLMMSPGPGGFILHTTKVNDDPNAASVLAFRKGKHKVPAEQADPVALASSSIPVEGHAS